MNTSHVQRYKSAWNIVFATVQYVSWRHDNSTRFAQIQARAHINISPGGASDKVVYLQNLNKIIIYDNRRIQIPCSTQQ